MPQNADSCRLALKKHARRKNPTPEESKASGENREASGEHHVSQEHGHVCRHIRHFLFHPQIFRVDEVFLGVFCTNLKIFLAENDTNLKIWM